MRVLVIGESKAVSYLNDSLMEENLGNEMWSLAIQSYFSDRGGEFRPLGNVLSNLAEDENWVRNKFDRVVIPMACIFADIYVDMMRQLISFVHRANVPTFIIGLGIQAPLGSVHECLLSYRDVAKELLDAIYSSGGMVAVRGELTRQVCISLGHDCPVVGCASLYVGGEDFRVEPQLMDQESFRVALNGGRVESIHDRIYRENKDAIFFDQDRYRKLLYFPHRISKNEMKRMVSERLVLQYEKSLLGNVAIFSGCNFPSWYEAFCKFGISFSYGGRMHGNVIALLAGVPCFIQVGDARVAEMAEFYEIPNSQTIPFDESHDSLYDLYKSLDWARFNERYRVNYRKFLAFLDIIAPRISNNGTSFLPKNERNDSSMQFDVGTFSCLKKALRAHRLSKVGYRFLEMLNCGTLSEYARQKTKRYWIDTVI